MDATTIGQQIKAAYPAYAGLPDAIVGQRYIDKYTEKPKAGGGVVGGAESYLNKPVEEVATETAQVTGASTPVRGIQFDPTGQVINTANPFEESATSVANDFYTGITGRQQPTTSSKYANPQGINNLKLNLPVQGLGITGQATAGNPSKLQLLGGMR